MQQRERNQVDDSPAAQVYQRYAPAIFAYAYRQIGAREDAEDLLLEVFLASLENEKFWSFSDDEQRAWLWRLARNKVADHFRRFTRQPSVPLKQVTENIYANDDLAPEQVTLKREEYANLHSLLQGLSEQQQEILLLRFGHGLRCTEIAPVLNKSEGAVRMLLSRTLRLLRTIYTKN